jgi:DNA-binding protein HU-beta
VNTSELVKIVSDITGTSEASTKATLRTLFSTIASTVAKGEGVSITGLARFSPGSYAPRVGRNPRTGEKMSIPASKKIIFKAGKQMKEALR